MGNTDSVVSHRSQSMHRSSICTVPLYEACRIGDEEMVRDLLQKYSVSDLNRAQTSSDRNTCLHIAAANGHDNIVEMLLKHGCYRSSILNSQNQSAYDVAASNKESTRLLFLRHEQNNPSSKSSRFFENNASDCFDVIQLEDNQDNRDNNDKKPATAERKPIVQTFKTEKEKKHEVDYSASSKAMCQSSFCRFCVNHLHSDEPLEQDTIIKRLQNLLEEVKMSDADDLPKVDDLIQKYQCDNASIEYLLHLYTLETQFYRLLKRDCIPLAIPLFINLPKLKDRYFKGRVYRGMHMNYEQLLTYQIAMEVPGTILQTRSFSSTSVNRSIAEEFAYSKKSNEKEFCVLFIYDFPDPCDQAINLSRVSADRPSLSEYQDEQEVLILPWTLFEVKRVRKSTDEDDLCTIHLTNVIIPKKNLLSTFKWNFIELKKHLIKEKKLTFDCAFQKYKTMTKN